MRANLKINCRQVRCSSLVLLACLLPLSACSSSGTRNGGEYSDRSATVTTTSVAPAEGFSSAFYKDGASGMDIKVPSGWNPHPFLGGTIAFAPTADEGYKARAFIQRQDPAVMGTAVEHLKAAELMLRKKKYATFDVVSREIKSPFDKEFGELIYQHKTADADPMLTDSLCVIPVGDGWVILQCSAASSVFARVAPQFDLIKNSLIH